MSECVGEGCEHDSHKLQGEAIKSLEVDGVPQPVKRAKPPLPRNQILNRVWSREGHFYFRMADGSLITPETAIRRGLIDRAAYEAAVKEEQPAWPGGQK